MKQMFRKWLLLNLLFAFPSPPFRRRLTIVGSNTNAALRWYLGKFLGMKGNWRCRRGWLNLESVAIIRNDRGSSSSVVFAEGGKKHLAVSNNTSHGRELLVLGDFDICELIDFLLFRHEVPSPSERFVHSLPDEIVLPETDWSQLPRLRYTVYFFFSIFMKPGAFSECFLLAISFSRGFILEAKRFIPGLGSKHSDCSALRTGSRPPSRIGPRILFQASCSVVAPSLLWKLLYLVFLMLIFIITLNTFLCPIYSNSQKLTSRSPWHCDGKSWSLSWINLNLNVYRDYSTFHYKTQSKNKAIDIVDNMAPRSRKKAKNSIVALASNSVVLKALIGMPMDIIFEVRQFLRALPSVQPAT